MLMAVDDLEVLRQWVIDVPQDDAPREAYASAVAGTDPDRAELIRLQLQIAKADRLRLSSSPASMQAGDLIRAHGTRWAGPINDAVTGWTFMRGFVEVVMMDAEWFLDVAEEVYALAPVLHLDLTDVRLVSEELFASPHLQRIISLNLHQNDLGDEDAILLAQSPNLGNLEWLNLSNNRIGEAGLEALAASPKLPRLGYVDFRWNGTPDPTPAHADEYDATTPAALALQEMYGRREWLDAHVRAKWPPERDSTWPSAAW
jgi:hypothetical protein